MTAEEFVREKIRNKFKLDGPMMGLQCYSINGEEALRWAHEYMILCSQENPKGDYCAVCGSTEFWDDEEE